MVVLATKIYVEGDALDRAMRSLESMITNQLGELVVSFDIGVRHDGFPTVTIEGEDAVVARNVLREEWGAITTDFVPGEVYIGTLESWNDSGFVVDAGEEIVIPSGGFELGPGTPGQIRERFGLVQHMRLRFEYSESPVLAGVERDRLFEWQRGLGRVNVNSTTRSEVRATVNRAGHANDIVRIERLGVLEQSIVCRESTDPPGLLASIGEYLPAELKCVIP
jgi:hypothetical protein